MQRGIKKSHSRHHLMRWVLCLLVVGWWSGSELSVREVAAQDLSYRLRLPRISDRSRFSRQMRSMIRSILMRQGFVLRSRRSIRKGYHLDISVAVEENFRSDEPATCTIQLALQIAILPQKRLVMTASSSGTSRFNKATKFTRKKRDRLRRLAMGKAMHYFRRNFRRSIRKIERKKRTLAKNRILGTKWRRGARARWRYRGSRGRALRGKAPRWKWILAGMDAARHRPPFTP